MTLLKQDQRYKGYIFTECSSPYEWCFFCRKQQITKNDFSREGHIFLNVKVMECADMSVQSVRPFSLGL